MNSSSVEGKKSNKFTIESDMMKSVKEGKEATYELAYSDFKMRYRSARDKEHSVRTGRRVVRGCRARETDSYRSFFFEKVEDPGDTIPYVV